MLGWEGELMAWGGGVMVWGGGNESQTGEERLMDWGRFFR